MALDLLEKNDGHAARQSLARPSPLAGNMDAPQPPSSPSDDVHEEFTNSVGMKLVLLPAGEFVMGSRDTAEELARLYPKLQVNPDCFRNEQPQHLVRIAQSFFLSVCEVTQQQYTTVMKARPWSGQGLVKEGSTFAATYVTWNDAVEFCHRLSDQDGRLYRLPTEAEWEYACRANSSARYHFGNDPSMLGQYAWFHENTQESGEEYAHEVGQKKPNAFGLFDMHGNVWEWCSDWYGDYQPEAVTDPQGPSAGSVRVFRGGSWNYDSGNNRSSIRSRVSPTFGCYFLGFRVATAPSAIPASSDSPATKIEASDSLPHESP